MMRSSLVGVVIAVGSMVCGATGVTGCVPFMDAREHRVQESARIDAKPVWLDAAAEAVISEKAAFKAADACSSRSATTTAIVDPDTTKLYGKGCSNGDGDACLKAGAQYLCGTSVEKNEDVALTMFEKSCALRSQSGCQFLASALLAGAFGSGKKRDIPRAIRIFDNNCSLGAAASCGALGSMMMMLGNSEAMRNGIKYLDKACSGGHLDSCGNLAAAEASGLGIPKNADRAFSIARAACEKNNAFSCGILGSLYIKGEGVKEDDKAAVELFTISCNGGEPSGCAALAQCHYHGYGGIRQDVEKATEYFRRACDRGNGASCRTLADLGAGGPPSKRTVSGGPTTF